MIQKLKHIVIITTTSCNYRSNMNVDNAFAHKDQNIYNMLGTNTEVNIRFSTKGKPQFLLIIH